MIRFISLVLVLLLVACSATQRELTDQGDLEEHSAIRALKQNDLEKGVADYQAAEDSYASALKLAIENSDRLWGSFLRLKLATCRTALGLLTRPSVGSDNQEAWRVAEEFFAKSAFIAGEGGFLQMRANSLILQASCVRSDLNPAGSWDEAEQLYRRAVTLCRRVGQLTDRMNDEKLGEALFGQATSMLQGESFKNASLEVIELMLEARFVGNREAARVLSRTVLQPR